MEEEIVEETLEEEIEEVEHEPQITSDDPEERKLARRLRIHRRLDNLKKQKEKEGVEELPKDERSAIDKQIETSAELLDKLLVEGNEAVTNIDVGNRTREINRRQRESRRRAEIIEKLEKEAEDALEMYQKISNKWEVISHYKDPLDISDSISLQREECNELIKQKDEIIAMLREEINQAELKYVEDQDIQKEDIDTLVRRIDGQIDLMRKSYKHELKLIEEAMDAERQILVDTNNKKWDMLYKQRNVDEEENMQKKIELADEFLQYFYDLRVQYEEKYRSGKIALERENEVLQTELEQLKAACLLNGEKLDYNYNILKKREEENLIVKSQQKRIINKLQDEINKIKKQINENRTNTEHKINKLTAEIKKTRNAIFQLEAKADQICAVNDKKYHAVWKLNEDTAMELLDKIRTTDKILHEQLLGIEYKYSKKTFFKKTNLPSYKEALEELKFADQKVYEQENMELREFLNNINTENLEIPAHLMHSIMDKIAFRAGFLLEDILYKILPDLIEGNQQLVKIDNVFQAIALENPDQLRILMELFMPYLRCPICEKTEKSKDESKTAIVAAADTGSLKKRSIAHKSDTSMLLVKTITGSLTHLATLVTSELEGETTVDKESTSSKSSSTESTETRSEVASDVEAKVSVREVTASYQCRYNHPVYLDVTNVYKILRNFVHAVNLDNEGTVTMQRRLARRRNSMSRLLLQEDVKMYWSQFATLFNKHYEAVWNWLLFALKKYHEILKDRANIYAKVLVMRKENSEILYMLKYCREIIKRKIEADKKRRRRRR